MTLTDEVLVQQIEAAIPAIVGTHGVVGIRWNAIQDWEGKPALRFRILLSDGHRNLRYQARHISKIADLIYAACEGSGLFPFQSWRLVSAQEKLKDPEWEMLPK